ncbi:MAG: hypothetical protein LBL90_06680 [Prevotellaceae bacterium]|jgi:hypothetical protein|nr:hypothetical protein [Prevotellaceae bacterium]
MKKYCIITLLFCFAFIACNSQTSGKQGIPPAISDCAESNIIEFDTTTNTIHIFVALCDNKYQGIAPVPSKIGNGRDPANNLYWGRAFGIRTYFKNSNDWKLLKTQKPDSIRLERLIFKHVTKNYYIVADVYNGRYIKQYTQDFLKSTAGQLKDTLHIGNTILGMAGNSRLVAYIGHNGLMDFQLTEEYLNVDGEKRDAVILACYSKSYFLPYLKSAGANPLVWTTGLMAPEAYTIHDAIAGYISGETNEGIREKAALAYSKYQKCSVKAAKNLLVTEY